MTLDLILHILSWACLITGGFLGITGGIGLFRFPDVYTRMHAASVTDTLCTILLVLGLALQAGLNIMLFKMLLLLFILSYTGPTASHVIAKAARQYGIKPVLAKKGGKS
ncbi:MAG: monovalent cation/H(+) antiporter subunit G [Pseudomonadota bacterium]|nr:monovalent cation/H(+) antiporter subunit G [Pseudomonadota bacterium]